MNLSWSGSNYEVANGESLDYHAYYNRLEVYDNDGGAIDIPARSVQAAKALAQQIEGAAEDASA